MPKCKSSLRRLLNMFNKPHCQRSSLSILPIYPTPLPPPFTSLFSATSIFLFFLFFLILLSNPHPALYTSTIHLTPNPPLSPLAYQLHSQYAIPQNYLRLIPSSLLPPLLQLLSSPPRSTLLPPQRRLVLAHISNCTIHQCFRAFASVLVYAKSTNRVPLIFLQPRLYQQHSSLTALLRLPPSLIWNHTALLIESPPGTAEGCPSPEADGDWATWAVTRAYIPGRVVKYGRRPNDGHRANGTHYADGIGNTEIAATLDNLAGIDTHVEICLGDVVWAKYSPRCLQEQVLNEILEPLSKNTSKVLQGATILGRHGETREIATVEKWLRDRFSVPELLVKGMSKIARKLLLLKLMSKQRKGVRQPRAVFVHAQYGLGNRLRALGSAMAFARRTDRVLVLIWVPDSHLNCSYTDLFVANDEFVVSDRFGDGEPWPFKKALKNDDAAKSVKWYNYMRINGTAPHTTDVVVTDDASYHIYVSTCYVIQSPVTPFIIRTQSSYWQVLRTLTPHIDVIRLIDRFANYPMSSMMGIHIRGRSIKSDISGVTAKDYTEESSKRTDYWRNLTGVQTFINEMNKQPMDQLFYVAADQKEVFTRLERAFPSRIFYTPRRCDGRDKECLPYALADILLLARCSSLRGSYWSSFSELSVRIGGLKFLLAGIDFGRP